MKRMPAMNSEVAMGRWMNQAVKLKRDMPRSARGRGGERICYVQARTGLEPKLAVDDHLLATLQTSQNDSLLREDLSNLHGAQLCRLVRPHHIDIRAMGPRLHGNVRNHYGVGKCFEHQPHRDELARPERLPR